MKRSKPRTGHITESDKGATSIEYAIMAGAITAVIAVAVFTLGLGVLDLFQRVPANW